MFVDIIIILAYISIVTALAATMWAVYLTIRHSRHTDGSLHGIPVRRISICIAAAVLALLVITFALGSSAPLKVNGEQYTDVFWIKASNMLVISSVLLIVTAGSVTAYALFKSPMKTIRRKGKKNIKR